VLGVDRESCTLCGACVDACPYDALEIVDDRLIVKDTCTLCGACVEVCPVEALGIEGREGAFESDARDVWVFGEVLSGKLHPVVLELAGRGRKLADDLGERLGIVVLGDGLSDLTDELSHYAIDDVIVADHQQLAHCDVERHASVLADAVRTHAPAILLGGATSVGRSLLPRLAVQLGTGLTADCTDLEIDPETRCLMQTRPAFGGNVYATIECAARRPQMATVRPRVMKPLTRMNESNASRKVRTLDVGAVSSRVELLESVTELTRSIDLAEANVIVSGGRGMKGPEGFTLLAELADALGGAVGASRAAVDSGWVPYAMQVGQTGLTVQPGVYIAMGISGAVQHLAGMQTSGCVVAVNIDAAAPIFSVADFGIVGDAPQVARELIRQLSL